MYFWLDRKCRLLNLIHTPYFYISAHTLNVLTAFYKCSAMTKARSQQICLEATPYYHCVSRCVRKAYLCGIDFVTKQNYEHRRAWLEQEILKQAQVFAIDVN